MNDFQSYKTSGDEWHRDPFYSSPGGFKLYLNVDANGYSIHGVSVYVYMLRGENEHRNMLQLSGLTVIVGIQSKTQQFTPMRVSLNTFSKLFQGINSPGHFKSVRRDREDTIAYGWYTFLDHDSLDKYVKDDKLKFTVSVVQRSCGDGEQ